MRVAVANPKGGAGRTTVAVNLAGILADAGRDVLFVDATRTGEATELLGLAAAYDAPGPNLNDAIYGSTTDIEPEIHEAAEFDVLPSNIDLATSTRHPDDLRGLARTLASTAYDDAVIDCPPGLDPLADAALVASERVVVPTPAAPGTPRALELLFDQIDSLEEATDTTIDVVGIVVTPVGNDSVATEIVDWLETTFEDRIPVWTIPQRVALPRSLAAGRSVVTEEAAPDVVPTFERIIEHL